MLLHSTTFIKTGRSFDVFMRLPGIPFIIGAPQL
jgi:hypothetical protein